MGAAEYSHLWVRSADGTDNAGFYGSQLDWQLSKSSGAGWRGEIFADMFIGWVYNKWEADDKGYGADRADYMNSRMPGWITDIINGR